MDETPIVVGQTTKRPYLPIIAMVLGCTVVAVPFTARWLSSDEQEQKQDQPVHECASYSPGYVSAAYQPSTTAHHILATLEWLVVQAEWQYTLGEGRKAERVIRLYNDLTKYLAPAANSADDPNNLLWQGVQKRAQKLRTKMNNEYTDMMDKPEGD